MITNETLALLEEMAVFAKVVETGSFSEAARSSARHRLRSAVRSRGWSAHSIPVIAAHDPQAASE